MSDCPAEAGAIAMAGDARHGRAGTDMRAHTLPDYRITNHCRSLVPLGAGPVVGVKGRPLFTRPMAVWHHLKRLQRYNAERWAQQQQS